MTTTRYKLQGMVKDKTVGAALAKALDDDGKLSYEEVLGIIYSTCDGNRITPQEVKDVEAILNNSRTIGNDPRIRDLQRRFSANPSAFLKYRHFSPGQLTKMIQDVQDASRLSQKCMNALVARAGTDARVDVLLRQTFNVSLRDRNEVASIQQRFQRCWKVLQESSFQFDHQGVMEVNHVAAAPLEGRMQRLVLISRQYLEQLGGAPVYRQGALIHEMIHHFNGYREDGHPGGIKPDGKLPLGVAFHNAVANPYCYQWFAIYLEPPDYASTITFENETVIRAR